MKKHPEIKLPVYNLQAAERHPVLNRKVFGISLFNMLQVPRFAGSFYESLLVQELLVRLPYAEQDAAGNVHCIVGENARVIFSAHTDTVHKAKAVHAYPIGVSSDGCVGVIGTGVLGADCAAGIYIMLRMIEAGVQGHYIFHRAEEIGGHGSLYYSGLLEEGQYDQCVAFDRAGATSVITHQSRGVCCSVEYASALAAALGNGFLLDDTGVFTDSANYVAKIPECTNISVGYYNEHSLFEYLNLTELEAITEACIAVPWETLPIVRTAQEPDDPWAMYYQYTQDSSCGLAEQIAEIQELVQQHPKDIAEYLYWVAGADAAELRGIIQNDTHSQGIQT